VVPRAWPLTPCEVLRDQLAFCSMLHHGQSTRRIGIAIAAVVLAACVDSGPPVPPITATWLPTRVTLVSDSGDFVGQGKTYTYTDSNMAFRVIGSSNALEIDMSAGQWWTGAFRAPPGELFLPGTYLNARRYGFQGSNPGMSWHGEHRGCNTVAGQFVVDSLAWSGGALVALSMSFEQHCEGLGPALRGTIRWRAR
jgi:hypothetical protein